MKNSTMNESNTSERILVVAPHADDEVLGVGGSIIKHVSANDRVKIVIMCNRPGLEEQQKTHALMCATILGVDDLVFLDFEDSELHNRIKPMIDSLESVYNDFKPTTVYGPWCGDINIDHQSVHTSLNVVCRTHQKNTITKLLYYEIPSSTEQGHGHFSPNYFNVIDEHHVNTKIEAFYKYTHELREYPNPRNAEGITTYAKWRGMQCSNMYAEAFVLSRLIKS